MNQHDPIGLYALSFPEFQLALRSSGLVNQLPAQAIGWETAAPKPHPGDTGLADEHFGRKFANELGSHRALKRLEKSCRQTPVILEQLGAVENLDARFFADELVIGALISILKPAP